MDRPITVRVIYYRRGWHQEQVVFTVNSSSNKKELKDAIALEIAEIVGLPSGGITIYWKSKCNSTLILYIAVEYFPMIVFLLF